MSSLFIQRYGLEGWVLRGWVWAVLWSVVTAGVVYVGVYGVTKAVRGAGAASCRTFARESGYPAEYKIQHWLDAGTCYVRLPNGHALPESMVRGFVKADAG